MDFNDNSPIYLQVIEELKRQTITGKLPLGSKLPSTRELALMFKINPNTAARVYTEMESMGFCFTKRGLGTFITEDESFLKQITEESIRNLLDRFIADARVYGITKEELIKRLDSEWT